MKKIPSWLRFFFGWRLVFAIIYVAGFFTAKQMLPRESVRVFSPEKKSVPANVAVADKETFDVTVLISEAFNTAPEK